LSPFCSRASCRAIRRSISRGPAATPQSIAEIRKSLGLDRPLPDQFAHYVNDLAHGNFGNSLSTGRSVAAEITSRLPASAELTLSGLLLAIVIAVPLGIAAAVRQGSLIDHLCRIVATAGVSLPVFFTGLLLVYIFYFKLGWSPPPIGRLDVFATAPSAVTGFYLIDALIARDLETFRSALSQLILPAVTLAAFSLAPITRMTRASMLAALSSEFIRTARASGLDGRTVILTYAFRNAMLPVVTTLGMVFSFLLGANVLVEKVFAWPGIGSYAVRGVAAIGLCAGAGLRADHGGDVCRAQSLDRHALRRDRSTREAGSMTEASLSAAPMIEVKSRPNQAKPDQTKPPANSIFRHAAYVVAENPVTGLSFGLFVVIAVCALVGPYVVPYDPLASDTSATLQSPSWRHWFGTDLLGRDIFSRVVAATRLDFIIAIASVALVLVMGGLAGIAAGFFGGWTDRIVGRVADTIMAFPLFVLAMGIVAALGNTVTNIVIATAIINFPLYVRVARAEANVRREAGFVLAARLSGNSDLRILPDAHFAEHHADHDGADFTHHGLRHPQRRGSFVHRPRRQAADA